MNLPYISVVVPVYNSAEMLPELFSGIDNVFTKLQKSYQLILIDDGSNDNSWRVMEGLKNKNPEKVIAIKFSENFGQHKAILCGFNYCKGSLVLTMDDDLQHPPEEIPKLIAKFEETNADVIYGMPIDKKHSLIRNAGSELLKKKPADSSQKGSGGSSFRLMKQEVMLEVRDSHHYNFLFLDATIHQFTSNIAHVDVEHHPRKAGKSGYTLSKLISLYLNIVINYSAAPLKIMTYGGLFASIFAFLFGVRFIIIKLKYNVPLGYTSLIVSILFSTGIILFCLGIIGQYLYKLYQLQNKRPPYLIQKVLK